MLLVDGHNLIGQLQDLSLDDPYDEAKLSMAIRSYCMRSRSKATVIFDNGVTGGVSKQLSNSAVKVIFAPHGVQADTLLMRRARDFANAPEPLVMVTSDRRILRLAFAYGIETLSSPEFAILIGFRPVEVDSEQGGASGQAPEQPKQVTFVYDKDPNPVVSPQEIAFWLPIFERRLERTRVARAMQRQSRQPRKKR
jgi:predicted RNA-binding protein with PIN domain